MTWHVLLKLSRLFHSLLGWIYFGFVSHLSVWSLLANVVLTASSLFLGSHLESPLKLGQNPSASSMGQALAFVFSSQLSIHYSLRPERIFFADVQGSLFPWIGGNPQICSLVPGLTNSSHLSNLQSLIAIP
jgi:hypothetical protein